MKKILAFFSWVPGKVAEGRDGGCKQAAQRQSQSAAFVSFPLWGKAGMEVANKSPRDKASIYPACRPPA